MPCVQPVPRGLRGEQGRKDAGGKAPKVGFRTPSSLEGSRLLTEPAATKCVSFTQPEGPRTGRGGRWADSALAVPVGDAAAGFSEEERTRATFLQRRPLWIAPGTDTSPLTRLHVPDSRACEGRQGNRPWAHRLADRDADPGQGVGQGRRELATRPQLAGASRESRRAHGAVGIGEMWSVFEGDQIRRHAAFHRSLFKSPEPGGNVSVLGEQAGAVRKWTQSLSVAGNLEVTAVRRRLRRPHFTKRPPRRASTAGPQRWARSWP